MHTNNIVSDNLPIYFIWFGSDVPPKYFGNLQRAAETNKSRDIILVYREYYLSQDNRKNIDSIESMSIDKIKKRVKLKRDSRTKNLFKIDVCNMKLNEQDEMIHILLYKVFSSDYLHDLSGKGSTSLKFVIATDIIKLAVINITGGIYFDIDTEIKGKIENLSSKYGINFNFCQDKNGINEFNNFFAKSNDNRFPLDEIIPKYTKYINNMLDILCRAQKKEGVYRFSVPSSSYKAQEKEGVHSLSSAPSSFIRKFLIEQYGEKLEKDALLNQSNDLLLTVILDNRRRYNWEVDYNNPEDLKRLGLDEQGDGKSSELENPSLEQPGNSQEKGR